MSSQLEIFFTWSHGKRFAVTISFKIQVKSTHTYIIFKSLSSKITQVFLNYIFYNIYFQSIFSNFIKHYKILFQDYNRITIIRAPMIMIIIITTTTRSNKLVMHYLSGKKVLDPVNGFTDGWRVSHHFDGKRGGYDVRTPLRTVEFRALYTRASNQPLAPTRLLTNRRVVDHDRKYLRLLTQAASERREIREIHYSLKQLYFYRPVNMFVIYCPKNYTSFMIIIYRG